MKESRIEQSPHHHHGHHDHTHGMAKQSLRLAFFLTIFILLVGFVGGLLAHSLALISDAAHSLTDLFALGLAWFAAAQAERPANERKTFGYHRVGILAGLFNAVSLIVIALVIVWEAVERLQHPQQIDPLFMFIAPTIGIVINLYIAFALSHGEENLNTRAAVLHVLGDIGASVAVIVAAIITITTGWTFVDPLLSILIALLVAFGAWRIVRETTDILLEATPRGISLTSLVQDMVTVEGVQDVHDLHVWSISSNMSALSCHVLIDNLPPSESSPILGNLKRLLDEKYQIRHATIEFECDKHAPVSCAVDTLYCRFDATSSHCSHEEHVQEKQKR